MRPLLIIPAKMGSTRIPDKNVRLLYGKSPLRRAIACCRDIPGGIILVTANWGKEGLEDGVYWHRVDDPIHTDTCSMVDVVLDALKSFPGDEEQPVLLVQPTQPLRQVHHLKAALQLLEGFKFETVASVVRTLSVDKLYRLDAANHPFPRGAGVEREQDANALTYYFDGTVYGFRRHTFLAHPTFHDDHTFCMIMPPDETCRLDTPQDWLIAGLLLEHRGKG